MSKSVSNDALWEKLLEIEERINQYLTEQKKTVPRKEQTEIIRQLKSAKDQITELFKKGLQGLGTHSDSHFQTMYGHIEQLEKGNKVLAQIYRIMKNAENHPGIKVESKSEPDNSLLNYKLFKVRKTIIVITVLGLLVFILILFCMKQQNDYVMLNNAYYRKSIVIKELQTETDSLKNIVKPDAKIKKKQ